MTCFTLVVTEFFNTALGDLRHSSTSGKKLSCHRYPKYWRCIKGAHPDELTKVK